MVELLADAPATLSPKIAVDWTRLAVDPADRGLVDPREQGDAGAGARAGTICNRSGKNLASGNRLPVLTRSVSRAKPMRHCVARCRSCASRLLPYFADKGGANYRSPNRR
jgi:hypothetical protein